MVEEEERVVMVVVVIVEEEKREEGKGLETHGLIILNFTVEIRRTAHRTMIQVHIRVTEDNNVHLSDISPYAAVGVSARRDETHGTRR